MAKTISTHNGSVANRDHNIRNPKVTGKQSHILPDRADQNEILCDEKPREAYKRIFGPALKKYNENQERPERRIKDYYSHICKDAKKHPIYEMIVQIGDRNDTGTDAPAERECLKEFFQGWKERNPNLECIGAYIHADEYEGTLHMHIDYVPVAHGYQKGLETQTGLVKALKEQGFVKEGRATAQIRWEARENQVLEDICRKHGIDVVHPMRDGESRAHLDTPEYKALQEKLDEVRTECDMLQHYAEQMQETCDNLQQNIADRQSELASLDERKELLETQIGGMQAVYDDLISRSEILSAEIREKEKAVEQTALDYWKDRAQAAEEELRKGMSMESLQSEYLGLLGQRKEYEEALKNLTRNEKYLDYIEQGRAGSSTDSLTSDVFLYEYGKPIRPETAAIRMDKEFRPEIGNRTSYVQARESIHQVRQRILMILETIKKRLAEIQKLPSFSKNMEQASRKGIRPSGLDR